MFLTSDEIRTLTGRQRPSAQARWLKDRNWKFVVNAINQVVVIRPEYTRHAPASVYVIGAGKLVKVGVATNPVGRLASLKTANPLIEGILFTTPLMRDAYYVESKAHDVLAKHHVSGEWFKCSPEKAIRVVKRLCQC